MFSQPSISLENQIADQTLRAAASNSEVKQALYEGAVILINRVLIPVRAKLTLAGAYHNLAQPYQNAFFILASELSFERHQLGAVLPSIKSAKEILNSPDLMHHLLNECEKHLCALRDVLSVDEMVRVMKIFIQLTFIYNEFLTDLQSDEFNHLKDLLAYTKEELDIRLTRKELDEPAKYAITTGIARGEGDLALASEGVGYHCGKSHFGAVGMRARLEWICAQYDNKQHPDMAAAMRYYKIPLNPDERQPLDDYVNANETWFEKLARDPVTKQSHPLVASYSGSMARYLIVMHDIKCFTLPDGIFDFNKAQLLANCMLAFLLHAGHHSFFEVAEAYNRFIDCIALQMAPLPAVENGWAEELLPYYRVGCYGSFFHASLRFCSVSDGAEANVEESKRRDYGY